MRHHHCDEFEPLLKGSSSIIRSSPSKKEIRESIHREQSILGSKYRSSSTTKWYIIFGLIISLISSYFNNISPLFINNNNLNEFQLSDFYFVNLSYILSILISLFIPRILLFFNGSSIITLIFIQFISLFGEILFYLGIIYYNIYVIYCARILNGLSLGATNSLSISILIFWFHKSNQLSISSNLIIISILISVILSKLFMNQFSISSSFILPVVINFVAIWFLFFVNCIKNRNIPPIYDMIILREFYSNGICSIFKLFQIETWLICINISFILSLIFSLFCNNLFIDNILTDIYKFDSNKSGYSLSSIISISIIIFYIIWSIPMSFIIDKYGYYIQYGLLSLFLIFLSFLCIFFGSQSDNLFNSGNNTTYCIISLCIFSFGLLGISSLFSIQILITSPIELSPYCGSIITILLFIFIIIFDNIRNLFNTNYLDSILFLLFCTFLQFGISIIIFRISIKKNLLLHHPTPNSKYLNKNNKNNNKKQKYAIFYNNNNNNDDDDDDDDDYKYEDIDDNM